MLENITWSQLSDRYFSTFSHIPLLATMLYKGCCHCGLNRFELECPEIKTAVACECDTCSASQLLWVFLDTGDVSMKVVQGAADSLSTYKSTSAEKKVRRRYILLSCAEC